MGIAIAFVATILLAGTPVSGHSCVRPFTPTVYIDPTGDDTLGDGTATNPYRTPQRAVDVVDLGGTVWVRPGAYPYRTTISRSVRISVTGPGLATFGPSSLPAAVVSVVGADDVTIRGINFVGTQATRAVHANAGSDRLVLDGCMFSGFGAGCVLVDGPTSTGHVIRDGRFATIRGAAAAAAIALHGTVQTRIDACTFASCDRGIDLVGANATTIATCTFTDLFQSAVVASGATDLVVADCRLTRCGHFATPRTWSTPADARGAISLVAFSHRARIERTLIEDCGGYTGKNTFVGAELFRYDGMFGIGIADSDTVRIEGCALHRNAFGGIHVTGASPGLVLVGCDFVQNGERNDPGKDTALYTGAQSITATGNFWGLPSGPTHDGAGFGNGIDGGGSVALVPVALSPFVAPTMGFAAHPDITTGQRPLALALADFDSDGDQDVAFAEDLDGTISVARNLGGGDFGPRITTVVGGRPVALAAGRFDAGSTIDLAVLDQNGDRVVVLLGNGDGTFVTGATPAVARRPVHLRVADLDAGNGDDIVVVCEGDVFGAGALQWLRNNGAAAFTRTTLAGAVQPTDIEVLDLNADLRPEIVAFDRAAPSPGLRQYGNLGGGTFAAVVSTPVDVVPVLTASLQRADIDGGADDLIVASYRFDVPPGVTTVRLFRGTGAGTLAPPVTLYQDLGPLVVRAAAMASPTLQSLVVVNPGRAEVLVIGPTVPAPTPYAPYASRVRMSPFATDAAVGDVSGDGRADLLLADGAIARVAVLRSEREAPVTTYGTGCAGTPGVPIARWHSLPKIGAATFTIAVERGLPSATAVFMLGATQLNLPLPGGCTLLVDPLVQLFTNTDVDGFGAITLPIPPAPWLVGLSLVGQWFVVDTGGQIFNILSASEGLRFTLGG